MIIVEGADNSGKSTLARALGLSYYSAGPAPTNKEEMINCIVTQRSRRAIDCVQDRLTCISQQVYSDDFANYLLRDELISCYVNVPGVVIVYCRPPERVLMDLSTHKVKSYDTEENLAKIVANQHLYIHRYDAIMSSIPHFLYDWTDTSTDTRDVIKHLINTQHDSLAWRELNDTMKNLIRYINPRV